MKLITWPEIPVTWLLHCGSTQAPPHISPSTGSCQAEPLQPWRHRGNCRHVVPGQAVTWSLNGHVIPPPWWITTSVRLTTSDISDLQPKLESPALVFLCSWPLKFIASLNDKRCFNSPPGSDYELLHQMIYRQCFQNIGSVKLKHLSNMGLYTPMFS